MITSATGSSKLTPKARKITITKSRYFAGSGASVTMSGVNTVSAWKTLGSTRK